MTFDLETINNMNDALIKDENMIAVADMEIEDGKLTVTTKDGQRKLVLTWTLVDNSKMN